MGKKHFCFFQTAETGNRTPNSGVKGSGDNHYPRAPAQVGLVADSLHEAFQTQFIIITGDISLVQPKDPCSTPGDKWTMITLGW